MSEAQRRLDALELPGACITVRPLSILGLWFGPAGEDFALALVGDDVTTLQSPGASVMAEVETRRAGFSLPEGYSVVVGGKWQTIQETSRRLVVVLAWFLVFVVPCLYLVVSRSVEGLVGMGRGRRG